MVHVFSSWKWPLLVLGIFVAVSAAFLGTMPAHAAAGAPSVFVPVDPGRIMDTRTPYGTCSPSCHRLLNGDTISVAITGAPAQEDSVSRVPSGATAVVLNVTSISRFNTTGFLTLYPSDGTQPQTSNLNTSGAVLALPNLVVVKLGASDGRVKIFDGGGAITDVAVDVFGYYIPVSTATGPSGPSGPPGNNSTVSGPIGPSGPSGANSTVSGPSGPNGPIGLSGPSGASGADSTVSGPSGPNGLSGPSGPIGATGPSGLSGPSGSQGVIGFKGDSGPTGATGPSGPLGPSGETGVSGPSGPQGPSGATTCLLSGSVACPSGPTGPNGDSGPIGPSGAQGTVGPTGATGVTGLSGPSGPSGPLGPSGVTGSTGLSGPSGPSGLQGLSGVSGPSGPMGLSGPLGPSGPTGESGVTGPSGATPAIQIVEASAPIAGPPGTMVPVTTSCPGSKVLYGLTGEVIPGTLQPTTSSQGALQGVFPGSGSGQSPTGTAVGVVTGTGSTTFTGTVTVILFCGNP